MALVVPGWQPVKLGPRVDINPLDLRKSIFQNGQRIQWQQATRCSCNALLASTGTGALSGFIGEPDVTCPACDGNGFLYHTSQEIFAQVTAASEIPKVYELYGQQAAGLARITLLPEHMPNLWDRFTLLDAIDIYTERRKRTSNTVEQPRYPIVAQTIKHGDVVTPTTQTTTVRGVLHAIYSDALGDVVGGATPVELVENTHFTVTAAGAIDWTLGDGLGVSPADGSYYSLAYFHRPVYVAKEFPFINRQTYVRNKSASPELQMLQVRADCWRESLGDGGETLE